MGRHGWNAIDKMMRQARRQSWAAHSVKAVWQADKGICHLCATPVFTSEASRDHIIPRSEGGEDTVGNVKLAHKACNSARGSLSMVEVTLAISAWQSEHPDATLTRKDCLDILYRRRYPPSTEAGEADGRSVAVDQPNIPSASPTLLQ